MIKFECCCCKNIFYRTESYVRYKTKKGYKIKYCSHECHLVDTGKKEPIKTNCDNCNKEIEKRYQDFKKGNHHFCSKSCSVAFNNKINPKRKRVKLYTCTKCLNTFDRPVTQYKPKLCPSCTQQSLDRFKNYTLGEYKEYIRSTNKNPHCRISDRIRYLNRTWNKNLLTNICQYCGYDRHAELSHKKAISEFSDDALLSEINAPSNNISLCPTHHWEYDNNVLHYEDIPERNTLGKI